MVTTLAVSIFADVSIKAITEGIKAGATLEASGALGGSLAIGVKIFTFWQDVQTWVSDHHQRIVASAKRITAGAGGSEPPSSVKRGGRFAKKLSESATGNWYRANDGTIQFSESIKSERDILPTEQFLGQTHRSGTTEFRKDGSIFFKDESAAYEYMWNNSIRNKREVFSVITPDGVLIMPEYKNNTFRQGSALMFADPGESFGYKYTKAGSKVFIEKGDEKFVVLATIHTHPFPLGYNGEDPNADLSAADMEFAYLKTPGKPVLAMGWDNKIYGYARDESGAIEIDFTGRTRDMLLNGQLKLIKHFLKWKL